MQGKSKEIQSPGDGSYRFREFDLSPLERQLYRSGEAIPLQPKIFDALLLFVRNAERLVRREELIETLWPDTHVSDANLTNVIVTLRKVLGRASIQTVSKFGYRFCLPVLGEPGIHQGTYATFLQAKELVTVRSFESMARARDLLALCVAEDPTFAAAWAWLGRYCRFLAKFAHHFYTQLQIDLGESRAAAVRLVQRIVVRGAEPESFAGLVQALRYCGLLEESLSAHQRATALDPALVTSVPHTHFLRCDYHATLETYGGTRYYLDAAAWAALGDITRATALLRERLAAGQLSTMMAGLMSSLLAALDNRRDEARETMTHVPVEREPEIVFYLARHYSMIGDASETVRMLQRARAEGFTSSATLERDAAFAELRRRTDFQREVKEAKVTERVARRELERAGAVSILRSE